MPDSCLCKVWLQLKVLKPLSFERVVERNINAPLTTLPRELPAARDRFVNESDAARNRHPRASIEVARERRRADRDGAERMMPATTAMESLAVGKFYTAPDGCPA
jgi:hypothetical protein